MGHAMAANMDRLPLFLVPLVKDLLDEFFFFLL